MSLSDDIRKLDENSRRINAGKHDLSQKKFMQKDSYWELKQLGRKYKSEIRSERNKNAQSNKKSLSNKVTDSAKRTGYIKNLEGASSLDELIKSKEKTSPQTLRSVTPEEIVSTRVEKDPRPSLLDALVNSQKGQSHISGAKVIQSALKDYGGDPDEIYDTSRTSADRRLAYEIAARKDPDNPLTKAENTKINIDMPKKQVQDEILSYTMMTDEEKRRYNEIYGMYGKYQAEEYRGRLRDTINQRIAEEQVKSDREIQNPFGRTLYMFGQGMASGISGVGESAEWISGMDRKKPTSVGEYTASGIRNDADNNAAENVIYDIAQSTGYMTPGIIASGALGALGVSTKAAQTGGNVLFGLAQSGNTYRQDINEGQDPDKAWLHGLQQGVDETATNWLLGGINAFGGGALKRVIANSGAGRAFTSGIDKIAKSQTGRVLLRRAADSLADMGSEAAQEYLQFYTENLTRNLLYGEDNSLDPLDPDAWYSAALGALNAGLLNIPGNVARTARGLSADVSMAKDTSEALDLDRSHYRSSEDYKKVETLKKVADEVASKAEAGTVSISDKVAYSEALADVLTSEANTGYNAESINNTDQVNVRMIEVSTGSETDIKKTMDEATEQWRKILTNPEMTAAVSTDGTSAYDIERQGEDLIFTHSVDGEVREQQAYKIADIGKGGDADILNVVPLQSADPTVPKLNTFVDYAKNARPEETPAVNESSTPVPGSSVISGQNNSQADIPAPAAVNQDTAVRSVSAEDRSEFGSYANVYSAALGSQRSTDNMISLWDGKNRDRYLTAYKRIYTAGLNDIDVDTMLRDPMNIYLTDRQREQAYKDGMLDANERKKNRVEFTKGEAREGGITKGSEQASDDQRDILNWVGDKIGLKIEVSEGLKGNAEINLDKGVMRINPYSKDFIGSVSHELTHMIKVYAPGEYDTLQRLTVSALMRSRNISYDELFQTYEEKYRTEVDPDYTVEDILEEITADGATAYMNDQDFADRIAREDKSLAKKIADFFRGIADTLRKLINEKGIRNVGRVMRENEAQYRIAANTWYNALEKAAARYKEGYTVNAPEMDWERYALRLNEDEITKDYIEHNYEIVTSMPPVAELTGLEFDTTEGKGSEAVIKYFDSLGNSAENPDAGVIDLTKRFVKDVLGHNPTRRKFIMMAAVPDIISEGRIIDFRKNYDGENADRITIAAPLTIANSSEFGGEYYGVVSIKVTPKNNRAYILNYVYANKKESGSALTKQTGVGIINSQRPGAEPPLNIGSILEKLQNYNSQAEGNNKTKFQMDEPVEETRDLIAVRNIKQSDLASMLELEGLPSPSIAITKADIGHMTFGDVTFIFGKSTIDPQQDSRNLVFDADAWTPVYDELQIDRYINEKELNSLNNMLYDYSKKYGRENMFNDIRLDQYNFADYLKRNESDLYTLADNSYDLKLLYLADMGKAYGTLPVNIIQSRYIQSISNDVLPELAERLEGIVKNMPDNGMEKRKYASRNADIVKEIFKAVTGKELYTEDDKLKNIIAKNTLDGISRYIKGEDISKTETDYIKAKDDIDRQISIKDYHKWIEDRFAGVIGEKGIRNKREYLDKNGERRSFWQLHDPYNAENIVKALWRDKEQGAVMLSGQTAQSIRGASARKFNSIDDMHAESGRLQNISEGSLFSENEKKLLADADKILTDVRYSVMDREGVGIMNDPEKTVIFENRYNDSIINAATRAKSAAMVKKAFSDNNVEITDSEAGELLSVFKDLRELPTDFFEAKPKRVVDWSEIRLAVVPDDIDQSLIDRMYDKGIAKVNTYPAGDNEARLEIERKAEDLRFQLDVDEDPEPGYRADIFINSSRALKDAADTLGTLLSAIDYMPSDQAIERTAKRLKKYTATDTSVEDISSGLKSMFNYIAYNNNINGEEISSIAADYAGELITNSTKTAYDPAAEAEYRRYRDAIKSYTFHLPAGFEGELEALGGVARLRREFFGTLNITKNKGVSIDTMYQELAELHPDLFDRDRANPADQLEDIVDHLRMLKPSPKVNYYNENDYDAYRYYAGQEIFKAYIAEGTAEAGRRSEYQNLKREYNRKLKENKASETEMSMLQKKATEMQARYLEQLEKSQKNEASEIEMSMLQKKATEMQTRYLDQLEKSKKMVSKQTMRQRVSEARQSTKMRHYKDQIIKDTKELSRWLLKPTDAKHVPEALRKPLAEFLQYVDFSSKEPNAYGEPTQRSELWMRLKEAWAAVADKGGIAEDGADTQYIEFDPDLVSKMQDLTDKIKNMTRMEDLDYIGVLQLSDIVKSMKHAITSVNELLSTERYKTVARAAESTLSELGELKTKPEYAGVRGFIQNVAGNRMLDAGTRFHTFGDAAEDIYRGLRNGFNQKIFRTAEAEHKFKEMLKKAGATSHDINKWSGQLAEPVSITTERGEKLTLTTAQVMSLYELMKRPQARDHILTGGITSARLRWHGRYMKTGNVKVTRDDVVNLIGQLSEKQKEVADGIAAIFQDTSQWGNNASMKLYGYKKFNDPHYFPIRVDRNYLTTTSDQAALNTNAVSIKNMGITKSTVPHANNPLVLDDIFQVFTEQVNNMSNYEAFVVPLSDLQKWYNFKDSDLDEKYKTSIKRELERTFGTGANQFINKFMEDINGLTNTERYFLKELISAFKGSAVGANLSVAIQQPTSYVRALAVMDPKYLLKAFTAKAEIGKWENIKKYSAIAAWKDWGFYEIDTGRTMRNILTDPDTPLDKAREWQMFLAAKGDQITWKRIWVAAELQVKDRHPELEAGSEAFFKEVARVFDDVIDRTQVVDSVFHRTDLMRSKNDLTQMSTSFMSEPMKSYSMIYRAVFDYTNAKTPEAKRIAAGMFGKSITAFLLSNAFAGMAKAIVLAMRDQGDERDKDFWDRWKGYAISESAGNVMPWNYFPVVRDVASIFEGYNVQRTDMNAVQDLYYVYNRWMKYLKGESQYTLPNNILYTTKALSTATGLALYGLQRDVNAVIDTAIEAFGADEAAYEKDKVVSRSIKQKSNLGYYVKRAMRAYQSGNTALGDKIVSDLIDAGIAEDDINSKMKEYTKKAIVEDPEGNEALTAAFDQIASGSGDGAIEEYRQQLISEGYDGDNIDTIIKSQADEYLEGNGINYNGLNDTLNEITSFSAGNFDVFYAAYKRWANVSQFKNGWDEAECRKNFRTQCTKYFKPLYKAGNATERSRILNILSRIKIGGEPLYEKESTITDWGKEDK